MDHLIQAYADRNQAQAEETLKLLNWMLDAEAQALTTKVNYSPLPEKAVKNAKALLKSVTYNGQPVLK